METQNDQSPSESSGNKRRRVRKACLPCRQRKRKCDAEDPCGMCSQYGYECIYPEDTSPLAPFVARRVKSPKQSHDSIPGGSSASSPSTTTMHVQGPLHRNEAATDSGVHDVARSRYVGASSAFAFPRALGLDFQSKNPPPLHSFGYTFGIRPEEKAETHEDLRTIIGEMEVSHYVGFFFTLIAPVFDFLEVPEFLDRVRKYYQTPTNDFFFGAIIAQVAAVGSFLAVDKGYQRELDLVQYAKKILEDPQYTRGPSIDHVVGWAFRTIYLRGTTRPNNAWLASCQAVHLCEALGLHDEECIQQIAVGSANASLQRYNLEQLRRIFWGAVGTNAIIACEYGRACVVLPHVTTKDFAARPGSCMHLQHRLGQSIPSTISSQSPNVNPKDREASLFIGISSLAAVPSEHPWISLTRGDLCFCFYRRLRQHRIDIPPKYIQKIIDIGEESLVAAVQFAKDRRPYWPVLGSVFQFACVLLALDTQSSLSRVANAFRSLEEVVRNIDTHMSREALATARLLLQDAMCKKKRELALLEVADGRDLSKTAQVVSNGQLPTAEPGNNVDYNIDWDQIFNESYNAFFGGSPQFDEHGGWIAGHVAAQVPLQVAPSSYGV